MNEETDKEKSKEEAGKPSPAAPAGSGVVVKNILGGLASAFGFGRGKAGEKACDDVGTQLAHERTDLAMNRSYLALERTLMAWIRTSLSMISFGFTIGKLGQVLKDLEIKGPRGGVIRTVSAEEIAHFLVILGTAALVVASFQHWKSVRELYAMGLRRKRSLALIVAVVLAALGGFALASLILAL